MDENQIEMETIKLLASRLERLSADSWWAHKASGLRGSLLRFQECLEPGHPPLSPKDQRYLEQLVKKGFDILARAAKEIAVPDDRRPAI